MTIDELEKYRGMAKEAEAIQQQLIQLRESSLQGIKTDKIQSKSNVPSNPTERTALKVLDLEQRLEAQRMDMLNRCIEITTWIESVDDYELRAIIRNHYVLGKDWNQTCFEVIGYYSYSTARKKVERYFEGGQR